MSTPTLETKHVRNSIYFPLFVCLIMVVIHVLPLDNCHGIRPREFTNLWGLLSSVFLHANWQHLWSNIGPLYLLLAGFFYYFPERIIKVPVLGTLLLNTTVWIAARDGCHVGASGLVYFLASYLICMAFFNKQRNLAAFVLIIVFLYGGMIWGVLPGKEDVSWESHLFGALWGIAFAVYFKNDKNWTELHYPEISNSDSNEEENESQPQLSTETIKKVVDDADSPNFSATNLNSKQIESWLSFKEIKYNYEENSENEST